MARSEALQVIVYNNHPEHLGEELAISKTATQTAPIPQSSTLQKLSNVYTARKPPVVTPRRTM